MEIKNLGLSFDDVLLAPQFSEIKSRKDVDLSNNFLGMNLKGVMISANMDTITGPETAAAMNLSGNIGALHRFCTIEENIKMFEKTVDLTVNNKEFNKQNIKPIVSIGIGDYEFERALRLTQAGTTNLLIDVAHGASLPVVEQYNKIRSSVPKSVKIIVGNFGTRESVESFLKLVISPPDALKIGIGGGSMCTTRIQTGSGAPTLGSLLDMKGLGIPLIADGGIRNSGDVAKAIAAGASMVMLGSLFSGTEETPGALVEQHGDPVEVFDQKDRNALRILTPMYKKYRGSASKESYEVQGKVAEHRIPEGESTLVKFKGPLKPVILDLEAGFRSAMTYSGAKTLTEFKEKAKLFRVTSGAAIESKPHGKK